MYENPNMHLVTYEEFRNLEFRKFEVKPFHIHVSWKDLIEFIDNQTEEENDK